MGCRGLLAATLALTIGGAGCGAAAPSSDGGTPTPDVVLPRAAGASPPPPSTPATTAHAASRRVQRGERPIPQDLDDPLGPFPCDFGRPYRGRIGESAVSVLVRRDGDALTGLVHYDREGPALTASGAVREAAAFRLTEQGAGVFEGRCDESTGTLAGTFTVGRRAESFSLSPRPADWPGLYRVERRKDVEPNHPACRAGAKRDEASEVLADPSDDLGPTVLCLPRDAAKRRAFLAENPEVRCTALDRGYRVFGVGDAAREDAINAILRGPWFEESVRELAVCGGYGTYETATSLLFVGSGFLTVRGFSSRYTGGAHPLNGTRGATAVDLETGRRVTLDEVVADTAGLRDLTSACLPVYAAMTSTEDGAELPAASTRVGCGREEGFARFLWGCGDDTLDEPLWGLTGEGLVIGAFGNPHALAALDGTGPILPWRVLARDGLLVDGSPAARLWAGASTAPPDALPCEASYEGDVIRWWHRAP